jgi:DNA-binding beta-propeller fold protein YncE
VSDALAVDERAGRVFVAEDNGSAAHVSVLDAHGRGVHHAGPVGVFPMAVAVDARAGHVVIVGGPLLQQSNAFDAITASLADFLSKHLKHMLTWFWGSATGSASSGDVRGSISVLSVPR